MSLVNMADVRSPTLPMKLPVTLQDLGLSAVEILNSDVPNPQHLHPDDIHATSVDNNTPRWWSVMTIEEYNSIKPTEAAGESTNKVIPALLGSQRMPNFDKLILAPSAQFSLTTMYMHATEMHVTTKIPTKWLMITCIEDVQQHRLRTGNQAINMFNRGYIVATCIHSNRSRVEATFVLQRLNWPPNRSGRLVQMEATPCFNRSATTSHGTRTGCGHTTSQSRFPT